MTLKINWNKQLKEVEFYIKNKGGIIGIAGSPDSACEIFSQLLRKTLKPGIIIKLAPDVETTNVPVNIVETFERKLNLPSNGSGVEILKDLEAESISVNNVSVTVNTSNNLPKRCDQIIQTVSQRLDSERVVIILYNYDKFPNNVLNWFIEALWEDGLETLVNKRLLLILFCISANGEYSYKLVLPSPELKIMLPMIFEDDDYISALDDIADIIMKEKGKNDIEAKIIAETLLKEWKYQPKRINYGIVRWLAL